MSSTLAMLVTSANGQEGNSLPLSAAGFAGVALLVFVSLLGLTWSFRNTSSKHR